MDWRFPSTCRTSLKPIFLKPFSMETGIGGEFVLSRFLSHGVLDVSPAFGSHCHSCVPLESMGIPQHARLIFQLSIMHRGF